MTGEILRIRGGRHNSFQKATTPSLILLLPGGLDRNMRGSMRGYLTIGSASCKKCRDETHAIEGQCCKTRFKALRVHHKIRTRRPKKRPMYLPVMVDDAKPHGDPFREIPVDLAPGFAPFPMFGPPQMLSGIPPSDRVDFLDAIICKTTDDATERQRKLIEKGMAGALAYSEIPLGPFLRTLAKIAHCYAASQVGLDGFTHLLPPIILGEKNHVQYFVGGIGPIIAVIIPPPKPDGTGLHQLCPMTVPVNGKKYVAAQIRLFSRLKPVPPAYLVIVGEPLGPRTSRSSLLAYSDERARRPRPGDGATADDP